LFNIYFKDLTPTSIPIATTLPKTKPDLITVHLKKKSPYKSNIQTIKGMTFQDLIKFVFPMGPSEGSRFIIKSSLDVDGRVYLSEQTIEEVFFQSHIHLWIDIEKTIINFDELFGDNNE
jgi:hypothetical protein